MIFWITIPKSTFHLQNLFQDSPFHSTQQNEITTLIPKFIGILRNTTSKHSPAFQNFLDITTLDNIEKQL